MLEILIKGRNDNLKRYVINIEKRKNYRYKHFIISYVLGLDDETISSREHKVRVQQDEVKFIYNEFKLMIKNII